MDMFKSIYTIVFMLIFSVVQGQNPVLEDPGKIEIESEFINGMQYVVLEKYDDALEKFRDIKDKLKNDGIADYEMAKIYYSKGKYDEAELYAKTAIKKDNSKEVYKSLLTNILIKEAKYSEAADILKRDLDNSYFDRKKYYRIADLYQRNKETAKAIEILNNLEDKTKNDTEIELYKFNIYLRARKYKKALKLVNKLLKETPSNIKILSKKALVFRMLNKENEAKRIYGKILELDPANPNALSYMSAVKNFNKNEKDYIESLFPLLENDKVAEDKKMKTLLPFVSKVSENGNLNEVMLKAARILLKQYPESAKVYSLYGDILYNSGKIKESASYYEKSLKYAKSNYLIWKQLMTIYTLTEDWKSLAEISENAIDYYPNQVSGYYYAGRANIYLGKIDKGLEFLEEALDIASPEYSKEIKLMQANAFIKKGNLKKADNILNSPNEDFSQNHPFYWELKGDLEDKKGNSDKAKMYWNKSFDLGNNTKRIKEKLGK